MFGKKPFLKEEGNKGEEIWNNPPQGGNIPKFLNLQIRNLPQIPLNHNFPKEISVNKIKWPPPIFQPRRVNLR